MEVKKYFLYPGYIFFSKEHYQIETILGSCVSVCLWDKLKKFGGMNHYIYANYREEEGKSITGSIAIPHLVKLMLTHGSKPQDIEAYIVGGARNPSLDATVGEENILIAEKILAKKKIKVVNIEKGGKNGRKLVFDNHYGLIEVKTIKTSLPTKRALRWDE